MSKAANRPLRPHALFAHEQLPLDPAPLVPGKVCLSHLHATGKSFPVAGDSNGKPSQMSEPELLSLVGQDGNRRPAIAEGNLSAAKNKGPHSDEARNPGSARARFPAPGTPNLESAGLSAFDPEQSAIASDSNCNLNDGAFAPVQVTSVKQQTHLALSKADTLLRGIATATQFPSGSAPIGECAISTAPHDAQLQSANQGYKETGTQSQDNSLPNISIAKKENQKFGADHPVNTVELAVHEKDNLVSAELHSIAVNVPPLSPPSLPRSVLADSGARDNQFPQPAHHGFDRRCGWPPPNDDAGIFVTHRERRDSQLIRSARTTESVVNERADIFSGKKNFSLAANISSLSELPIRSSLVGGSAGAGEKLRQPAGQGFSAPRAQLHESLPAAFAAEPKGARTIDETSPIPVSTFAVDEPCHPGSAVKLPPAAQIALSVISPSGIGVSIPETVLAQPQPAIPSPGASAPIAAHVQILHLQLEPEGLGKVVVKMRLSGARLELQVESERPETMRIISDDTKLLSERLQSAGYAIDTLAIQTLNSHASHSGQGAEGASQEQHGDHTGGGTNFHDRPSMREDNSPPPPQGLDGDTQDNARIRPFGRELYL
jgi:hypothetical protein